MLSYKHLPKFPLIETFHSVGLVIFLRIQCQFDLSEASFTQLFHDYVLIDLLLAIPLPGCRDL